MSNFTFSCFINVSNSSLTDFAWTVKHPDDSFDNISNGYAISAIVTLLFVLGVPWNLLVIGTIISKKLYTQPIIMLMFNLTVTNLLLALLVMPFNIVSGIKGKYAFGETDLIRCGVCQTGVMLILLPWVSIYTLSLMAVDRFIYLKQPLKYATIVTPKRTFVAVVALWALCVLLSLPPLFGFGEINFAHPVATCVPILVGSTHVAPNYYYILFLMVVAIIPILILFILYVWIVCIIRSSLVRKLKRSRINSESMRKEENAVNHCSAEKECRKSQIQLVWLFGAIFTANIITWMPMVGLAITAAIVGAGEIPTLAFTFPYLSFLSETVIHPILEVNLIHDIKTMLSKHFALLRRKLRGFRFCGDPEHVEVASSGEVHTATNGYSIKGPVSSMIV